ncbi:methyl-accepting chemotaxis protein [Ferrimonas aestuarii]|uniref:HAMP domain-containing protein n=1 Tax=Ferrimonas aestuarii TaxID=2569539 RepID=A0A4U1BSK7_9GAMM|nr:methyl-accepting chemotaxis protein [Ferrimonas aestuarii]TKB57583.1 HAMP domain-containing protein [Ferrimonas aestuarii]
MILGKFKLDQQFNLLILPLTVLGFAIISFVITSTGLDNLSDRTESAIRGNGELVRKNISQWVQNQDKTLHSLSESPLVKGAQTPSQQQLLSTHLVGLKQAFDYRNVALLDKHGIALAASNSGRIGQNYGQMDYFNQAQSTRGLVISEPRPSRVDGTLLVSMAIKTPNAEVLFLSQSLADFYQRYVDISTLDSNAYSFILSSQCQPLAHPRLGSGSISDESFADLCGVEGSITFEENGNHYQGWSQFEPITGWQIISATNLAPIEASEQQMIEYAIVAAVIISIIIGLTIWLLVRSITSGLSTMVTAADDLSAGDIALSHLDGAHWTRLLGRKDEIGQMASAMNTLIEHQQSQVQGADAIAKGDLTHTISATSSRDSLGNALSDMQQHLQQLVDAVKHTATRVGGTTSRLNTDSLTLSQSATEQFTSISTISAALQEIDSQVKLTADSSEEISGQAQHTLKQAELGTEQMGALIGAMSEIQESGEQISKIMEEITAITEQTNLIALNAAIEAARAGEHGRGFSVVADEVRHLAQRSATAAQKTNQLVGQNQIKMNQGSAIVTQTEKVFSEIVAHINHSADQLSSIAQACREQSSATDELTEGLSQIDAAGHSVSEVAEAVAAQCNELQALANSLRQDTDKFKTH